MHTAAGALGNDRFGAERMELVTERLAAAECAGNKLWPPFARPKKDRSGGRSPLGIRPVQERPRFHCQSRGSQTFQFKSVRLELLSPLGQPRLVALLRGFRRRHLSG